MIKRTPQEIADFFQCYVAMDENGDWKFYKEEPEINSFADGLGSYYIMDSLIKYDGNPDDWIESLCKPDTCLQVESDIHWIADYYGITSRFQLLMGECAELSVKANNFIRGKGDTKSLFEGMADVEIALEQIKYLMKLSPEDLARIKLREIIRQLDCIAEESVNEEDQNE